MNDTTEQFYTPNEEPTLTPTPEQEPVAEILDVSIVEHSAGRIREEVGKVVVGQAEMLDLLLVAIFTGGHVLLEGVPGIAKTLSAKLLARSIDVAFNRIQFTPDLMPADVVGTSVFNVKSSEFFFKQGPIFSNIVLIDEINRAPAKTQSALFEVMEEQQVTVDGTTYVLESPFLVMATQNPIEQEGTYKLPEAQLDRFLFKIIMDYPKLEEEKAILYRFRDDFRGTLSQTVKPVLTTSVLAACKKIIEQVFIRPELLDYIAEMVCNTRNNSDLFLGASPRASLALLRASKAMAAISGRNFVTPDDIRAVVYPTLNHRVILTPEREMEGYTTRDVLNSIIQKTQVPR
jgi:MoxR-like ATPase